MATDESPKDYSSVYREEPMKLPVPPVRRTISSSSSSNNSSSHHNHSNGINTLSHPAYNLNSSKHHLAYLQRSNTMSNNNNNNSKQLDGQQTQKRASESTVDLIDVAAKLQILQENHHAYAMDTLNTHYSSVFNSRRRTSDIRAQRSAGYKAYIQFYDEKDTYVVHVGSNTLRAVRDKLPKRGNYRYFFKQLDKTCEEIESDDATVPYHQKGDVKQIYCQVFPIMKPSENMSIKNKRNTTHRSSNMDIPNSRKSIIVARREHLF